MDRYPSTEIRRALKVEVGFVCPIPGCASPYLTYHHFDPPWHEREHHEPEGMIALCLQHHKEADVGTYTSSFLRDLKDTQRKYRHVEGRFNWRREKVIFIGGGTYFFDCAVMLQIRNRDMLWLTKSEDGFDLFNIDLFSTSGDLIFSMRDNEWRVTPRVDDIECPPSARLLSVRSKEHDVSLELKFSEGSLDQLRARVNSNLEFDQIASKVGSGSILICEMSGKLRWPLSVDFTPTRTQLPGNNTLIGCLMAHCGVGLRLG